MHSESLPFMLCALRIEAIAHRMFSAGTDKYLSACNRMAFALLKPAHERLRRRVMLDEHQQSEIERVLRMASEYHPDLQYQ